jgi:hypothetical protein
MQKQGYIFLIINFIFFGVQAQQLPFKQIQDSLSVKSRAIWKQAPDNVRLNISATFQEEFFGILSAQTVNDAVFDSVYGITVAVSPEKDARFYTWNVPLSDGTNKYFAVIQLFGSETPFYKLQSVTPAPDLEHEGSLPFSSWYGGLYYKVIPIETAGTHAFTLLGWDGYNNSANRKMIDILIQSSTGEMVFGWPIFKTDKGLKYRYVAEYAENSSMSLKYDYQAVRIQKGKKVKKQQEWMIVMDHLVPMDEGLHGMRNYYVPSGDIYDGFIFRDGFWLMAEDIEVGNTAPPSK